MSFLSGILNFFKKLWSMIKKVLVYIAIACAVFLFLWAVFASGGALLTVLGFTLTATQAVVAGLALLTGAFLIDKDTAKSVVDSVASAVQSATEAVATVTASAATGVVSGLTSSPIFWVAIAAGAIYLFGSNKKTSDASVAVRLEDTRSSSDLRVADLNKDLVYG